MREELEDAFAAVVSRGWFVNGPALERFEERWSDWCWAPYAGRRQLGNRCDRAGSTGPGRRAGRRGDHCGEHVCGDGDRDRGHRSDNRPRGRRSGELDARPEVSARGGHGADACDRPCPSLRAVRRRGPAARARRSDPRGRGAGARRGVRGRTAHGRVQLLSDQESGRARRRRRGRHRRRRPGRADADAAVARRARGGARDRGGRRSEQPAGRGPGRDPPAQGRASRRVERATSRAGRVLSGAARGLAGRAPGRGRRHEALLAPVRRPGRGSGRVSRRGCASAASRRSSTIRSRSTSRRRTRTCRASRCRWRSGSARRW